MAAGDRCELTDLLVSDCAHCRGIAEERPIDPELGPWFAAAYPGHCARCSFPIRVGNTIRADGHRGYLCQECG
jgi:hypothetical protein